MNFVPQHPIKILVAEDSKTVALFIVRVLRGAGYEVALAEDGERCLDMVHASKPDLIVLDLMMPKVHGLDVLKQVKSDPATQSIGIIVCSAKDFKTEVEQTRELGAFSFLPKPFTQQELLSLVEQYFASRTPLDQPLPGPRANIDQAFYPKIRAESGSFRMWGTRGSIPVSGPGFVRHGGNTSCMEVICGDEHILFDAGSGIRDLGLSLLAGAPRHLHLFITHTHWDHIQGFPFFAPAYIPGYHITLYAPANIDKGLESIFRGQLDRAYFPVQMEDMRAHLEFRHLVGEYVEIGDCRISWTYTVHPSPTVGYKVEINDRNLVYMPDNEFLKGYLGSPHNITADSPIVASHSGVTEFLHNVDTVIHEAQYTNEEYVKKIGWGHTSLSNACALIKLTEAKRWIIPHHDPTHDDDFLQRKFNLTRQLLASMKCKVEFEHAHDGMVDYDVFV